MKPNLGWLSLLCGSLPVGWVIATGVIWNVPTSALLWQIVPAGILSLGLWWWTALRRQQELHLQTGAAQKLRQVLQEADPKPPRLHQERDAAYMEWQQAWNQGVVEVCESLQQLRLAQQGLESQRQLLETVLGAMQEGVLVLDTSKQVLFINGACRQLLDVRLSEAVGRSIWEVTRSQVFLEYVQAPLAVNSEARKLLEFTWPAVTVEIAIAPLMLPSGSGLVIVLHDVTQRKQLERTRRDFFNSVSHELKTPLTSIQCWADTLLDGGLEDQEQNRFMVGQIATQTEKLHGLIRDLLRLAKMESRQERSELQPLQVATLIREVVGDLQHVARSRNITLHLTEPLSTRDMRGEEEGFCSILENLINNAINYNRPHGEIFVSCQDEGSEIVLAVRDTGMGIEAEHRGRIFERFYRTDSARTSSTGGTGLGLAIVQQLVELFDGRIEVDSEVGLGSTFRVRFPALDKTPSKST